MEIIHARIGGWPGSGRGRGSGRSARVGRGGGLFTEAKKRDFAFGFRGAIGRRRNGRMLATAEEIRKLRSFSAEPRRGSWGAGGGSHSRGGKSHAGWLDWSYVYLCRGERRRLGSFWRHTFMVTV
jgi:hypothetical protein